jgi:ribosomal protein L11 methyltransferase
MIYDSPLMSGHSQTSQSKWQVLTIITESVAREAVEYALMESGALGTETVDGWGGLVNIKAYFDAVPNRERVREELADALRIYELPTSSVRDMVLEEVADQDWLGEWKKNWQPVTVGRFVIAPPWSDVADAPDRIVIRIEPGMAFGTGTHETTRLCLRAIEHDFTGESFLDVGTGTGILAIAAAKLFPDAKVEACDNDPLAVSIARENAELNEVSERIDFRVGSVDDSTSSADFVCANLTADVILRLLPSLVGATCGRLVLSGILQTQLQSVLDRLEELGISNTISLQDGEWVAVIV